MATIATLSASVKADVSPFQKGMSTATGSLKSFASDAASFATGNVLAHYFEGIVDDIKNFTKEAFNTVAATGRLSDRLGVTTEDLGGFELASKKAGVEMETFVGGIEKMLKNMGDIASGGGKQAADTLKRLGINMSDITGANQDTGSAFKTIAEAIKALPTPFERASAAAAIFGKKGVSMLGVIEMGGDKLEKMSEHAHQLGLSFSRIDAAKVQAANAILAESHKVLVGIGTQIAINIAPYISVIGKRFQESGEHGATMGERVTNAMNYVLEAIAKGADYLELFKAGWYGLQGVVTKAVGAMLTPLEKFTKGLDYMLSYVHLNTGAGAMFDELTKGLDIEADNAFAKAGKALDSFQLGTNSQNVRIFFQDIQKEAQKAGEEIASAAEEKNKIFDSAQADFEALLKNDKGGEAFANHAEQLVKDAAKTMDDKKKKPEDFGQFKQIDLARTSVEGLSRMGKQKTEVHSSQADVTNKLLADIKTRIAIKGGSGNEVTYAE